MWLLGLYSRCAWVRREWGKIYLAHVITSDCAAHLTRVTWKGGKFSRACDGTDCAAHVNNDRQCVKARGERILVANREDEANDKELFRTKRMKSATRKTDENLSEAWDSEKEQKIGCRCRGRGGGSGRMPWSSDKWGIAKWKVQEEIGRTGKGWSAWRSNKCTVLVNRL